MIEDQLIELIEPRFSKRARASTAERSFAIHRSTCCAIIAARFRSAGFRSSARHRAWCSWLASRSTSTEPVHRTNNC